MNDISLRDYFAGQAIAGLSGLMDSEALGWPDNLPLEMADIIACWAYAIADKAIEEKKETEQ